MAYSHRDRRAHRDVRRDFEIVLGAVLALGVLVLVAPWSIVSIAALVALAGLGAIAMWRADRLFGTYARDLAAVRAGSEPSGFLRAEVASEVGLERRIVHPSAGSPHRRRGPVPLGRGEETDRTDDDR